MESVKTKKAFVLHGVLQAMSVIILNIIFIILPEVILNYTQKSRTYFEGAHSLVRLEAHFRNNLAASAADNSASFLTILVIQAKLFGYRPSTIELLRLHNTQAVRNFQLVYNTTDYMRFMIARKETSNARWQKEFLNYAESIQRCGSQPDVLRILLSIMPKIYKYNVTVDPVWSSIQIGLVTFLRNFEIRNTNMLRIMKSIRSQVLGKEPPFEFFTLGFTLQFINALFYSTEAMQASYNGVFAMIRNTIIQLKLVIVYEQANAFDQTFLMLCFAMFFVTICVVIMMLSFVKHHNKKFNIVLESYRLLRHEEVRKCSDYYSACFKILNAHKYDEPELADSYLNYRLFKSNAVLNHQEHSSNKISHSHGNNHSGNNKKGADILLTTKSIAVRQQQNRKAMIRRIITIKQNHMYSSSYCVILTNALVILTVLAFFSIVMAIKYAGSKIHQIEKLYFDASILNGRVNENLSTHFTYVNYGNFIKIDGKYIEDSQPAPTALRTFNKFWLNNRDKIPEYFPEKVGQELTGLLYGNLCDYLFEEDKFQEKVYRTMCNAYLPSAYGLISYLNAVDQHVMEDREIMKNTNPNFLAATRKNMSENYDKSLYLTPTSERLRDLSPKVTQAFVDKLFEATDSALSERFNYILSVLGLVNGTVTTFVVILFSLLIVSTYRLMQANSDVCRETFANMLPEVVFSNPHLSHTFEHHVSASK